MNTTYGIIGVMLYTRKGDKGDTGTFGCDQRMSKSSAVAEALGTLDECNSFLGICKTNEKAKDPFLEGYNFADMILWIQQQLFIVQAHVAGSKDKTISKEKITHMEQAIDMAEKELPPIKTFFVSGGTVFAAHLDVARTLARRAERRVVACLRRGRGRQAVSDEAKSRSPEKSVEIDETILMFLNRLSSLLYAMARLSNHRSGITEESPHY